MTLLLQTWGLIEHWWAWDWIEASEASECFTCLNSASSTDLKNKFKLHIVYSGISKQINICNLLVRRQSSKWSQVQALASHLAITCKGYSRIQSKVLTAKSQHRQVGQASTNTGHFQVYCSYCGQWQACFRKKCYQSCYAELSNYLAGQKGLNAWAKTTDFFEGKLNWVLQELVTGQSCACCLALSFIH